MMIFKNNRCFGKDISNLPQNHSCNQSQQICEKKVRKNLTNLIESAKQLAKCDEHKIQPKKVDSVEANSLPSAVSSNSKCIPQYFIDVFQYMRSRQNFLIGNYCQKTINVDKNSRGQIVNWIIDVHYKFKLFPQTLYLIVYFMDKYLSQKNIQKSKLQLIAISCLYMTSKYEETYRVPQLKDLLNLCNYAYTKRDILQTEADIIKVLCFDLVFDSSFKFLEALEIYSGMNKKNFHLAQYLLELALTQSEFLEYSQGLMACSAFYLVSKIRKLEIDWDEKYQNLTSFKQTDLHKCARQLCNLLQKIDNIVGITSLKKKFSQPEFDEVTRLKLQRKK